MDGIRLEKAPPCGELRGMTLGVGSDTEQDEGSESFERARHFNKDFT